MSNMTAYCSSSSAQFVTICPMAVDLSVGYIFPTHIAATDLWPDIVWWSDNQKAITMIELTVCFETSYAAALATKEAGHFDLIEEGREVGYPPSLITVEMGKEASVTWQDFDCSGMPSTCTLLISANFSWIHRSKPSWDRTRFGAPGTISSLEHVFFLSCYCGQDPGYYCAVLLYGALTICLLIIFPSMHCIHVCTQPMESFTERERVERVKISLKW